MSGIRYSSKEYLLATGGNVARQLLLAAGVMLQTRIALHYDMNGGGVWIPYLSTWPLGMFFEIGVSAVVARLLGWSGGRAVRDGIEHSDASTLVNAGQRINRIIAIVAGLACALGFAAYSHHVSRYPSGIIAPNILVGLSFGLLVGCQVQGFYLQMALAGLGLPSEAVKIRIPVLILAHGASIAAALAFHTIIFGYVIWPICSCLEVFLMHLRTRQIVGPSQGISVRASWDLLGPRVMDGITFSASSALSGASQASSVYLIGSFLGSSMVPIYTSLTVTAQGLQSLVNQAITTYGNRITFLAGRHGSDTKRSLALPFLIGSGAILAVQFLAIPAAAFIFTWITGRHRALPMIGLWIAAAAYAIDSIGHCARVIIWSHGKWPFLKYCAIQLVVILAAAPFIIPRYGILGCLGTLASTIIFLMTLPAVITLFHHFYSSDDHSPFNEPLERSLACPD